MTWTSWIFGSVAAAALMAGCGGERRGEDAGTAGAETETGTMQEDAGTGTDTAIPQSGATGDTAGGARLHSDTNNPAATGTGARDTAMSPPDTARRTPDTTAAPGQ